MRELSKWMLALLEAWVCGDALGFFRDGQNVAVIAWLEGGTQAVVNLATSYDVAPKKYPSKISVRC